MNFTLSPHKLCAAAMAVGAVGILTSAPPSQAKPPAPLAPPSVCTFTKNSFGFKRSDGNTVGVDAQMNGTSLGPRGRLYFGEPSTSEFDRSNGNVSGSLDGNQFSVDFTITYDDGPVSGTSEHYHGFISSSGAVSGWVLGTKPQINWNADPGFTKCSADSVVPNVTATVLKQSDVYDAPSGNRIAEPFFLDVGRQLALGGKCKDDWCQLIIPDLPPPAPGQKYGSLPPNQGWVYEGDGFLTVK